MEPFFSPARRTLQANRHTIQLADRLLEASVTTELSNDQARFVASRPLFFWLRLMRSGFLLAHTKAARQVLFAC